MRGLVVVAAAAALVVLCVPSPAQEVRTPADPPVAPEEGSEPTPAPRPREWLSGHQSADGGWSPQGFPTRCTGDGCDGTGTWQSEVGTTGLALLAFTGSGITHKTPRYGSVVLRGYRHLEEIQDSDGCFGVRFTDRFVEDHAIATLAVCEVYGPTLSPLFKQGARRGLEFLLSQRNPDGGWRSGDRSPESEVGATAWAVAALRSAKRADPAVIEVDDEVFRGALAFLDGVTDPETGRVRWSPRSPPPPSGDGDEKPQGPRAPERATAMAAWARIHCGCGKDDPLLAKGVAILLEAPPAWDEAAGTIDPEYWFCGAFVCFQAGGETWRRWKETLKRSIVDTQVLDKGSCRWGSWNPVSGPAAEMGRLATTALCVLCLDSYYRYGRVFGSRDAVPPRPPAPSRAGSPPGHARGRMRLGTARDLDFPEPRTGFVR